MKTLTPWSNGDKLRAGHRQLFLWRRSGYDKNPTPAPIAVFFDASLESNPIAPCVHQLEQIRRVEYFTRIQVAVVAIFNVYIKLLVALNVSDHISSDAPIPEDQIYLLVQFQVEKQISRKVVVGQQAGYSVIGSALKLSKRVQFIGDIHGVPFRLLDNWQRKGIFYVYTKQLLALTVSYLFDKIV